MRHVVIFVNYKMINTNFDKKHYYLFSNKNTNYL